MYADTESETSSKKTSKMKIDIKLSGVGGQGILSIATVIGEAGISQRGGDVQSDLRLSTEEIFSDQISLGKADLIISMEPMEALRYLPYLHQDGVIVTSSKPFVNIPNYPDEIALQAELDALPHVAKLDIDQLAKDNHIPKSANMILLGMATRYIKILSPEQIRKAIAAIFARKGEQIVNDNLKAFDLGYENI